MELRTRSRVASYPRLSNYCAQCGEVMFMPEWSEYLSEHRVRHLWTAMPAATASRRLSPFAETATAA